MIVALQLLALLVVCYALLGIWRSIPGSTLRSIAAAGFILRAIGATAAFFISFLDRPFLDHLHLGNGFWFYAIDSVEYFQIASRAAEGGLEEIWLIDRRGPSFAFSQLYALALLLFGRSPASAMLLNLAAYLGMAYLIGRWGMEEGRERVAALSLAAVSFIPTWIVWSTQPLKDGVFVFAVVVYLYALSRWRAFFTGSRSEKTLLIAIALMIAATYVLAGIRWYFPFIAWGTSAAFFLHTAIAAERRAVALLVAIVPFVLIANVIRWTADPYLTDTSRRVLATVVPLEKAVEKAADIKEVVEKAPALKVGGAPGFKVEMAAARRGSETVIGSTQIETPKGKEIVAGAAVTTLPKRVVNTTGVARVRGEGRGLWLLADVDTLFFDAVLIIAIATLVKNWRGLADPLAAQVVILTLAIAIPLFYVVNNFGTLIRLREMIFIGLALIPLATPPSNPFARSRSASASAPPPEPRTVA